MQRSGRTSPLPSLPPEDDPFRRFGRARTEPATPPVSAALDASGNLKAVQALLGYASISTTADTDTDWDVHQLETSILETFAAEDELRKD